MIDTNKLRRLAQAAMHPVTKGRWMRLFGERTVYDRMEDGCRGIPVVSTDKHPPSSFEAACLDFIAAANPAAVSEILDRLEAAESDGLEQARLLGMSGEREAALLSKLEAAEKERNALRAKIEATRKAIEARTTGAQPAPSVPDGWKEAAIAWEVCASIHREYGKGKDPFFNTRQGDFVKHANDARAMLATAPEAKP